MWVLLAACVEPGRPGREDRPDPETGTPPPTTPAPTTPGLDAVGALVFDGPRPRNVWMLSLDTLRRDHVDPHATDGVARSPFLAARMAEGVLPTDHQQCSNWTLHSMTCTLAGHAVEAIGWVPRLDQVGTPLPDEAHLLAERLAEARWTAEVASANGYFGPDWNSIQGFGPDRSDAVDALPVGEAGLAALRDAVAAEPDRPWLLHVHVKEPHDPYTPPEAYLAEYRALPALPYDLQTTLGTGALGADWDTLDAQTQALALLHLEALYTAEIRWLDDQLAALWAEMDAEGFLDDTLVVVWSDHGEAMFEHGSRDHGRKLYREENDGVLAFWARSLQPATWTGPTHAVDVVPTVLAVLDVAGDTRLSGAVVGTADPDRPRLATTVGFAGPAAAVTVGTDKLLYKFDGQVERHDLASDPGEVVDLHVPGDPRSAELWTLLEPLVTALDGILPEHDASPPEL